MISLNWVSTIWGLAMFMEAWVDGTDSLIGRYVLTVFTQSEFEIVRIMVLFMSIITFTLCAHIVYHPEFYEDNRSERCHCGQYTWECDHD